MMKVAARINRVVVGGALISGAAGLPLAVFTDEAAASSVWSVPVAAAVVALVVIGGEIASRS